MASVGWRGSRLDFVTTVGISPRLAIKTDGVARHDLLFHPIRAPGLEKSRAWLLLVFINLNCSNFHQWKKLSETTRKDISWLWLGVHDRAGTQTNGNTSRQRLVSFSSLPLSFKIFKKNTFRRYSSRWSARQARAGVGLWGSTNTSAHRMRYTRIHWEKLSIFHPHGASGHQHSSADGSS